MEAIVVVVENVCFEEKRPKCNCFRHVYYTRALQKMM